jgi:hypothetical protein
MIEGGLLRIDKHVIPTDFIILDMRHDDKLSIILGKSFLSTAGANIDCTGGKMVFNIYDDQITRYFPKKPEEGKYFPPAKRTQEVNAFDSGKPKVSSTNTRYG